MKGRNDLSRPYSVPAMTARAAAMIQVTCTTRSGLMPDSSARSSLSEKARIDLPVRVFCRNQNSATMTTMAVTTVTAVVVLIAKALGQPGPVLELLGRQHEPLAIGKVLLFRADDHAHQTVHHEHHARRDDDQNDRLGLLPAVEPIDPPSVQQHQRRCADKGKGQGQQRGRQRPSPKCPSTEPPGEQDRQRRAKGHRVATGKVGKPAARQRSA